MRCGPDILALGLCMVQGSGQSLPISSLGQGVHLWCPTRDTQRQSDQHNPGTYPFLYPQAEAFLQWETRTSALVERIQTKTEDSGMDLCKNGQKETLRSLDTHPQGTGLKLLSIGLENQQEKSKRPF